MILVCEKWCFLGFHKCYNVTYLTWVSFQLRINKLHLSEYGSLHSVANWRYEESRIMAPVHSKPPRRPYNYVYNLFFYNKGRIKFRYADVLTDYGRFTKSIDDLKIREGLRKVVII